MLNKQSHLFAISPHQGETLKGDFDYEPLGMHINPRWFDHEQPMTHIIYVYNGSFTLTVNQKRKVVRSRQILLLFSHQASVLESQTDIIYFRRLSISPKMYSEITARIPFKIMEDITVHPVTRPLNGDNPIVHLYANLIEEKCLHPFDTTKDSLIYVLFSAIIDVYSLLLKKNVEIDLKKSYDQQLYEQVGDLVLKHYKDRWRVKQYAHALNVTPEQVNESVKRITGMTVKYRINRFMLYRIRLMLRTTDKSMETLSLLFHFPSTNAFNQYFRAQTDESPTQYRKRTAEMKQNNSLDHKIHQEDLW